jgi:hypothetical protein
MVLLALKKIQFSFRVFIGSPEKHLWHGTILGYYLGFRELNLALADDTGIFGGTIINTTPHFIGSHNMATEMHGYHFKTVEVCYYYYTRAYIYQNC